MIIAADPIILLSFMCSPKYFAEYKNYSNKSSFCEKSTEVLWTNENIFKHYLKVRVEFDAEK